MRKLILLLVVLAFAKIGLSTYLYYDASRDVIISAYRQRAIEGCALRSRTEAPAIPDAAWSKPAAISLSIGKYSLPVYVWQIDNPLWNARHRNPYLFITPAGRGEKTICEYDIVNGSAIVSENTAK
jgi:hypothetical protein